MSKKGIGWSVLGFLIVAGITCAIALPYHSHPYKSIVKNTKETTDEKSTGTSTTKADNNKSVNTETAKPTNQKLTRSGMGGSTVATEMKIKTNEEVPSEVIIAEEKPSSASIPVGAVVRPEYCWIENKPTKSILAQNIICVDGIIDLTDYGLPGVEANIKIGKNEKGEDRIVLSDENDKEVGFKYTSTSGNMFGRQKLSTVKVFALGFRRTLDGPVFVVMMCSNALLKGGEGKISLAPRVDNLLKQSIRQVLEELYLPQEDIDYLIPASEKLALK